MMTMSEAGMALDDADLRRIGDYVKGHMYGWLAEVAPNVLAVPQILERIERIEQQLVVQQHELKGATRVDGGPLQCGRRPVR